MVTGAPDDMVAQTATLRALADDGVLAGIHVEGPFLSEARCGAQDPRFLTDPDPALIERLLAAAGGQLRVMTLAPERRGFDGAARLLAAHGVVVALGHSDANYAEFRGALAPGGPGTLVTHLANGMPPLHHRAPGPAAAALVAAAERYAIVELIGDGVHIESGFAALTFAAAPGRVALVTDAMQAAGLPDGEYRLGPQPVRVTGGVARVASGAIAGVPPRCCNACAGRCANAVCRCSTRSAPPRRHPPRRPGWPTSAIYGRVWPPTRSCSTRIRGCAASYAMDSG